MILFAPLSQTSFHSDTQRETPVRAVNYCIYTYIYNRGLVFKWCTGTPINFNQLNNKLDRRRADIKYQLRGGGFSHSNLQCT